MRSSGMIAGYVAVATLIAASAMAADPISRSERLPETAPWNLVELSQPPAFTWEDESGPVRSLFYSGEPYGGSPTRVFAYYANPATLAGTAPGDAKYPAMVLIHGGGGTAFREWAELWARRGYAAIAMDLAGHRPIEGKNAHARENRTRLDDGGPDQGDDEKFGSIDKPPHEQWPYHAVAAAVRAHSLIRSFPEVDAGRTAVTGISWGGYLTCIVSAVDSRFQAAVPVYGCGFLNENSAWVDRLGKMTPGQRDRWVSLWDPGRYLPAVSMPILFVNGTNDFAYPLDSYMKSYASVPGEKQLCIRVNMPHGHPQGWAPREIGLFVDQHLIEGVPLPVIGELQIDDEHVAARITTSRPLKEAALHQSIGEGPINQLKWESIPAALADGVVSAPTPPAGTTAWFLTVMDERDALVSSPVRIKKAE